MTEENNMPNLGLGKNEKNPMKSQTPKNHLQRQFQETFGFWLDFLRLCPISWICLHSQATFLVFPPHHLPNTAWESKGSLILTLSKDGATARKRDWWFTYVRTDSMGLMGKWIIWEKYAPRVHLLVRNIQGHRGSRAKVLLSQFPSPPQEIHLRNAFQSVHLLMISPKTSPISKSAWIGKLWLMGCPPVSVNKILVRKFGPICGPNKKTKSVLERAQLPM